MMNHDLDYVDAAIRRWGELRPDDDLLPFAIVNRIRRLAGVAEHLQEEAVKRCGFSVLGDYQVAALLRRETALQPSELADRLRVTRAGITGRLKRLELQSMIARAVSPSDARHVEVTLTSEGRDHIDRAFEALRGSDELLIEHLSPTERQRLDQSLRMLLAPHDPLAVTETDRPPASRTNATGPETT